MILVQRVAWIKSLGNFQVATCSKNRCGRGTTKHCLGKSKPSGQGWETFWVMDRLGLEAIYPVGVEFQST